MVKDQETYRLFLKLFRRFQTHQKETGEEPLTDEEVERLALSATEEHESMVAMNKEHKKHSANLDNSQQ